MPSLPRARPWLAALLLWAVGGSLPAQASVRLEDVPGIVTTEALDRWLDDRVPWPRRDAAPHIRLVNLAEALRLGGMPQRGHGLPRGLYDAESRTIYLVRPWAAENPQDRAVLLHELVHHRQAPHHFYCDAVQEMAAYRAQEAWLAEYGLTARINWIAVTLHAGCTPRDIHPD